MALRTKLAIWFIFLATVILILLASIRYAGYKDVFLNLFFVPMSIFLIGGMGWFLTKRAIKPLDEVVRVFHCISSGDLTHRIDINGAVTEIRELISAFNKMAAILETSFQQIHEFSENVSHELRTPLSILKGQTELSLKRVCSDDEYRSILKSNLEEILRMEEITKRLLFLSKADQGEIEINWSEIDMRGLLEWVKGKFEVYAREKKIQIDFNVNGTEMVMGDDILLRELLFNLVQNALKYTPEGGNITLSLERLNKEVLIAVTDTGIGIPEKVIPHIFDRFYQVDKSRSIQGSGLGLSICKWIAESHRGRIIVDSVVDKGSKFKIYLPKIL